MFMWDNYYDTVKLNRKTDKVDANGNIVYLSSENVPAREVNTEKEKIVNKEGISIKYNKEYQLPVIINEGDKIDDRVVIEAERGRGVFGKFHFSIARVE